MSPTAAVDISANKSAPASLLDVSGTDLFDFSDDDFLGDIELTFSTGPASLEQGGAPAATSSLASSSPSSKSLDKLRRFKFSKADRRHSDHDLKEAPPAKRRSGPLCRIVSSDEVAASQQSDVSQTDSHTTSVYFDVSSGLTGKPMPSATGEGFKQPSFNPRLAKHRNTFTPHTPSKHVTTNSAPSTGITTPSNKTTPVFTTPKNRPPMSLASHTPMIQTPISTPLTKPRFPGPAGLLPNLGPGVSIDRISVPPPSTPAPASTPRLPRLMAATPLNHMCQASGSSDGTDKDFTQGPWSRMMEELDIRGSSSSALLQFSISQALSQAALKKLHNGKVTHLRVLIKSIVPSGGNATAVLKDPTGEILGTFHSQALEDHPSELQPGAALVLRQVSMFSPSVRKHYLNITADNIVRVYTVNGRVIDIAKSDSISAMETNDNASINGRGITALSSGRTEAPATVGVIARASEVTRETAFFSELCEDEFDELFSDVSESAFGF